MGNSNEKNSGLTKNESVIVNESENIAKSKLKKAFHSYFILVRICTYFSRYCAKLMFY